MKKTATDALNNFKKGKTTVKEYSLDRVVDADYSFEELMSDEKWIEALIESILEAIAENAMCSFTPAGGLVSSPDGKVTGALAGGKITFP